MAAVPSAIARIWKRSPPEEPPPEAQTTNVGSANVGSAPALRASLARDFYDTFPQFANSRWYRTSQYEWEEELIRSLTRRDGFAERAVDSLVLGALRGNGIVVDFGDDYLNAVWSRWRWNSLDPEQDVLTLERLMGRAVVRDGEMFLVSRGGPGELYLDWYSNSTCERQSGAWQGRRQGGIEFDDHWRPRAYHFTRPSFSSYYSPYDATAIIPAGRVAHVYRQDFDGQVRGQSWIGPALGAIEMLSQYTDDVGQALHILVNMPQYVQLTEDFGQMELSELSAPQLLEMALKASPDRRVAIPPGAELHTLEAPRLLQGAEIGDVVKVHEGRISRGTGVSTHTLTGSQAEANLSSIRAGESENQLVYQRLQHTLIGGMRKVVAIWRDFYGVMDRRVRNAREAIYTIPQGSSFDYRDRAQDIEEINAGVRTRSQVIRDRGEDPEAIYAEMLSDAEMIARIRALEGTGMENSSNARR